MHGNEGVYGLYQAFKIAGAKYLVMSLWQVPDRENLQLITRFYRNWLQPEDGRTTTIQEVFRKIHRKMRERLFNLYYWTEIVLVEQLLNTAGVFNN
ncbi:MAG: CHAT domain-containing protein [Saprospiraceae bacterium]|nr:CHAT domain-containing protein [Saprospiraceae bacterium]